MGQLLELFVLRLNINYFLDVDEKLGQTVENKLSFIDENIDFILEEFLAIFEFNERIPFLSSSGMVALNIMTCLLWGVLTKICWMSALMFGFPRTLSHSSMTKNLH